LVVCFALGLSGAVVLVSRPASSQTLVLANPEVEAILQAAPASDATSRACGTNRKALQTPLRNRTEYRYDIRLT
jgi:hypothetical protein